MPSRYHKHAVLLLLVSGCLVSLFCCTDKQREAEDKLTQSLWHNVYDTSVRYVGMEVCRGCHQDIYQTFIQTGMGQSFGYATRQKSAAEFGAHALVYDKDLDFYYKPYWRNDSLYIMEFRLKNGDTVHKYVQNIDYIIGSGQHTNSHIFSVNGYLYQAPVTFYTQKKQWDLAPGFEKGASVRFSRMIESECMTCHNGYPEFVDNSLNKFVSLKTGIDCERCHGPGSMHVADKQKGIIVDTSVAPDYSIVNPRRLSTELQNNVCMRCHLQGIAVLNEGKTFFDFRPGMHLKEVMTVFMPEYEGAEDKMIMASHVERMKKSACYNKSGKMSCITCHNPHVSVRVTPRQQFLNACQSCHTGGDLVHCSEDMKLRMAKNDDCVTCHMPHNGSIDIPHVAVTDHWIRKRPMDSSEKTKIRAFLGLKSFNNSHPDALMTARAYLEFFERYNPDTGLLDSALFYLAKTGKQGAGQVRMQAYIRAYFLLKNYTRVVEYATEMDPTALNDAWTAYRVGESYYQLNQPENALQWYKRSTDIMKYGLDFQSKYAACLLRLGRTDEALPVLQFILSQNPKHIDANTNMGFVCMQRNENASAYEFMKKAEVLSPDNEQNLINLAVWYHNNQKDLLAKKTLLHLLSKYPGNKQARAMLRDLQ